MNCPSCGQGLKPTSVFCSNCGVQRPASPKSASAPAVKPKAAVPHAASKVGAPEGARSGKHWLVATTSVVVLVVAGAAAMLLLVRGGDSGDPPSPAALSVGGAATDTTGRASPGQPPVSHQPTTTSPPSVPPGTAAGTATAFIEAVEAGDRSAASSLGEQQAVDALFGIDDTRGGVLTPSEFSSSGSRCMAPTEWHRDRAPSATTVCVGYSQQSTPGLMGVSFYVYLAELDGAWWVVKVLEEPGG